LNYVLDPSLPDIFVDIDGVFNKHWLTVERWPVESSKLYGFDPGNVAILQQILDQCPANLIISSAWRKIHTLEEIRRGFSTQGGLTHTHRIVDRTPTYGKIRGDEIKKWRDDHNRTTTYLILDDSDDMLDEQLPHFLKTHYLGGLTPDHLDQCLTILRNSL